MAAQPVPEFLHNFMDYISPVQGIQANIFTVKSVRVQTMPGKGAEWTGSLVPEQCCTTACRFVCGDCRSPAVVLYEPETGSARRNSSTAAFVSAGFSAKK